MRSRSTSPYPIHDERTIDSAASFTLAVCAFAGYRLRTMYEQAVVPPPNQPPKVIFWFNLYAGFLTFMYLVTAAFSIYLFVADPADVEMSKAAAQILGAVFLGMSLVLIVACMLPLCLRPRPWLWTYNLVLICLGMTGCTLPACIPLLIFWIKPEAKRYFGKS